MGLKHLDLDQEAGLHDEMWGIWSVRQGNAATIRKPQNVRGGEKLSWKELRHFLKLFQLILDFYFCW